MAPERWNFVNVARPVNLSMDDEDEGIQVGGNDSTFSRMEFLEELHQRLTEEERYVFGQLIRNKTFHHDDARLPLLEKGRIHRT